MTQICAFFFLNFQKHYSGNEALDINEEELFTQWPENNIISKLLKQLPLTDFI